MMFLSCRNCGILFLFLLHSQDLQHCQSGLKTTDQVLYSRQQVIKIRKQNIKGLGRGTCENKLVNVRVEEVKVGWSTVQWCPGILYGMFCCNFETL